MKEVILFLGAIAVVLGVFVGLPILVAEHFLQRDRQARQARSENCVVVASTECLIKHGWGGFKVCVFKTADGYKGRSRNFLTTGDRVCRIKDEETYWQLDLR